MPDGPVKCIENQRCEHSSAGRAGIVLCRMARSSWMCAGGLSGLLALPALCVSRSCSTDEGRPLGYVIKVGYPNNLKLLC